MIENEVHYQRLVKFFGVLTDNLTGSINGRAGYRIVILSFRGRMNGGTATAMQINISDGFHAAFGKEGLQVLPVGSLMNLTLDEVRTMGEGRAVTVTVDTRVGGGATGATSCDAQIEYVYEPVPLGTDG